MDPFGIEDFIRQRMRRFLNDDWESWNAPQNLLEANPSNVSPSQGLVSSIYRPFQKVKMDVTETKNGYDVVADLPGIPKEDIRIYTDRQLLTIEAERRLERSSEDDQGKVHFRECQYGNIQRSISLPRDADTSKVQSSFSDGVLKLSFPKTASSERKQITL